VRGLLLWNRGRFGGVNSRMRNLASPQPEMLDQDLQIIRVTLATIVADVRRISTGAADAIQEALQNVDQARREFAIGAARQHHAR
jgi:hypothetical protein